MQMQLPDPVAERVRRVTRRREELVEKAALCKSRAELCWGSGDMDRYAEHLREMRSCYALLALLSESAREELESFRLAVLKEIVRVEGEMQRVDDRLSVTRGNAEALVKEASTLGQRHFRLYDQYEAATEALTLSSGTSPR